MSATSPTTKTDNRTARSDVQCCAPATRETERHVVPPVDIYETSEGLALAADLPGVSLDDIHINIDDQVLTIEGRSDYQAPQKGSYKEFELYTFHRRFKLNQEVDQEGISATLKNGVLFITLPKTEKVKPKQVKVRLAS